MRKKIIIFIFVFLILLTGFIFINRFLNPSLPVYLENGETLTYGNQTYKIEDINLEAKEKGKKIGKVNGNLSWVFEVKGQSPEKFIIGQGFMVPDRIYRNINNPKLDFLSSNFVDEIQIVYLKDNKTEVKSTQDKIVIQSFFKTLNSPRERKSVQSEAYNIHLLSNLLPGISCGGFYLKFDKTSGDIFIEKNDSLGDLNLSDKIFAEWVKANIK